MLFESMLAIGAVLLIVSGGAKFFDRAPTRGALAAARLPSHEAVVVGLATIEVVVGASVLSVGHPIAPVAMAVLYVAFAGFVVYALRNELPIQSCGCFGKVDTPPSPLHVVVNLALAAGALAGAGTPRLVDRLGQDPLPAAGFLAMAGIGAYLIYLILAELPATMRAARGTT